MNEARECGSKGARETGSTEATAEIGKGDGRMG